MSDLIEQFDYLKPLHERHLEMLTYLNTFMDEHGIEWSLAFGSVLGARRHGGPIPWDDDVDIMMTDENYNKFCEAFHKYGDHKRFYLQECYGSGNMVEVPKLRYNNTTFIENFKRNQKMHHGIFIDIFILHNAPESKFKRKYGKRINQLLYLKKFSNAGYMKKKFYLPLLYIYRLFPKKAGFKFVLKFAYKYDKKPSKDVVVWDFRPKFIPRDVMYPIKKIKYEGITLPVPNKTEEYLKIVYNNWEEYPNLQGMIDNQHNSTWDVNKDYKEYLPNCTDTSDELLHRDIN